MILQYAVPDVQRDQHQPRVSKMYRFSSSSLGRLKDTVSMNLGVQNPTRFEVATALIHECGRAASKANNSGIFIPSLSCHLMNLHPPLPLNTIGNDVHFFNTRAATEDEIQVPHFVAQLCKAVYSIQTNFSVVLEAQTQPQLLDLSPKELKELAEKYLD